MRNKKRIPVPFGLKILCRWNSAELFAFEYDIIIVSLTKKSFNLISGYKSCNTKEQFQSVSSTIVLSFSMKVQQNYSNVQRNTFLPIFILK